MKKPKRYQHVILFPALFLVALAPGSTFQQTKQQPQQEKNKYIAELEKQIAGREKEPAEKVFKNIEIFTGWPAARVLRVMTMAFEPALGVDCMHCHVENEWDKDSKKQKRIARKMWKMQAKLRTEIQAIVEDNDAAINCYSCHGGEPKPALSPKKD